MTVGEKVLVLAKRLRKKDAPCNLYKSTTENISLFNREEIFVVKKVLWKENSYNYWISKTTDSEVKKSIRLTISSMDLIFIYYNDLKFQDNKIFIIKFSNGNRLDGVLFKKKKDYYLVSMSCFIEITNDLSELTHYSNIKKISDLSNSISKNGIDHSYEEKNLKVTFDDVKIELTPERNNCPLSVDVVEFLDYVTKQKRLVFIYFPYKELKQFGLKSENKKTVILTAIMLR